MQYHELENNSNMASTNRQSIGEVIKQKFGCSIFILGILIFCISSICITLNIFYLQGLGEDIKRSTYVFSGLPLLLFVITLWGGIIVIVVGVIIALIQVIYKRITK